MGINAKQRVFNGADHGDGRLAQADGAALRPRRAAVSPGGKALASAGNDLVVRFWRLGK